MPIPVNNLRSLFAVVAALLVATALILATVPTALAQDTAPADAETAAPADAPGDDAAAETGPAFPAGLDATSLAIEEFELRLIPLTVDELTALADAWQAIARERTDAVVEKSVEILNLPAEAQEEARAEQVELTEARGEAFKRYSAVIDDLERKGGDEAAVAGYRAYRNAIAVQEKQKADWKTLARQAGNWMISPDGGIQLATRIGVIVASFIGLIFVARIVRRVARRMTARVPNLSKLLQAFLAVVAYWLTIAFGLMIVLSALGVDITPVFALIGGASFILAFALQDTLGNLAAGLMIMLNRPFDEGDYVSVAGTAGTVKEVSVVSTTVTTPDNQVIVIPNSKVWGDVITNANASDTRRVDLTFGIGYGDSIAEAQQVLEEVVENHPLVLKDPAPVIRVNELGASSVDFICRPWVRSGDYFTVYWDLTRAVKEAFDARGISIPFPQMDMHIQTMPAVATPAAASGTAGWGRPEDAGDYASGDEGHAEPGGAERD